MDNIHLCCIDDIKLIEDTKFYTPFADSLIEVLVKAVQSKRLKPISVLIWITLKTETNLRSNDDWSIKKSIRSLMKQFGIAKSTAQAAVKELCEEGFIIKELNRKSDQSQDAMTLKVRFPKAGIELAELSPNRSKKKGTEIPDTNKLPPEVGQKEAQGWVKKQDHIKKTRKQILENNKGTELPTEVTQTSYDETKDDIVDCCLPSAIENQTAEHVANTEDNFEADPLVEELGRLKDKLSKIQANEALLAEQYSAEPGNLEIYHRLSACRRAKEEVQGNIENISNAMNASITPTVKPGNQPQQATGQGSGAHTPSGQKKAFKRRQTPIILPEAINQHIDEKLKLARKTHGISGIETYAERIKLQLSNFEFGESLKHAANICIAVLKRGEEFMPPGGCSDAHAINQREQEAKQRKKIEIRRSRESIDEVYPSFQNSGPCLIGQNLERGQGLGAFC